MRFACVTRLMVSGASSAAAARQVETALSAQAGVELVRVDPATGLVLIRHDESVATAELIAAVEKVGYRARAALPGEGSAIYASSPWGVLRPEGRTPAAEAALCRTLTVVGLGLVGGLLGIHYLSLVQREDHARFMEFILGTVAQAVLGSRFYAGAGRELADRRPGIDFLVALASTCTYVYSAAVSFGGVALPPEYPPLAAQFHTAAIILTAAAAGQGLESWLRWRSGSALRALVALAPPTACVLRGEQERSLLACDLVAGDTIVVRPGERFPADGTVVEGHSAADESVLTGEPLPAPKGPGDPVIGGTLNGNGQLVFRAEKVCGDTALAQTVRRVTDAEQTRPAAARTAERVARVLVLAGSLVAVAAFLSTYYSLLNTAPVGRALEVALLRGVAVLLAACPWALLLAVPSAHAAAVARAAREGIVFRAGTILEDCVHLRAAAFIRSGTLTLGRSQLVKLVPAPGAAEEEALALAAAVAAAGGHPLGRALVEAAQARREPSRPPPELPIADATYLPGRGARGLLRGEKVLFGRRAYLAEEGADIGPLAAAAAEVEPQGLTVRFLAAGGRPLALLAFVDPVRPGAAQVVASLAGLGVQTYVISGEGRAAVKLLGEQAGVPPANVFAEVSRAERSAQLRAIREQAGRTAVVGDGLRDVPFLELADVGIAIGCGTDVAAGNAQVALIGADLHGVLRVLRVARRMVRTARQNLVWGLAFCIGGIPLAVLAVPGYLHPVQVALLMVTAAVAVAFNSYRLGTRPPDAD